MKANELRHKNLVNYHGKAIEVFGVLGNVIYYNDGKCHDSNIGDYIAFEPIPLTPEWLERLKNKIEWLYCDKKGYYLKINSKKTYIKFVHSLQNTYFCIEQKELIL